MILYGSIINHHQNYLYNNAQTFMN